MSRGGGLGSSTRATRTRKLVERWLGGCAIAERRLFERHREALVRCARNRRWMRAVGRYAAAEDLADEVFLRVVSSGVLKTFEDRGPGSLGRFLERVLDAVAMDTLRRHGREKRGWGQEAIMLGDEPEVHTLPVATDTSPTERARTAELLATCRALLDEREWDVFRACELEGRSSPEVAARHGVTPAAIRGVLLRAKRKLLHALAREWQGEPSATLGHER